MSYLSYFSLTDDPFVPQGSERFGYFESQDFKQATARLNHLKELRGMGLMTGFAGAGKTTVLRAFADSLHPAKYRVMYQPMNALSVREFYVALCLGLGLEPSYRKIDMYRQIQAYLLDLAEHKKITPVLILDEAQAMNRQILLDLPVLLNFHMERAMPLLLILSGLPEMVNRLHFTAMEPLTQRLITNYNFLGLSVEDVGDYLLNRLNQVDGRIQLFDTQAITVLHQASRGAVRVIDALATRSLRLASQLKLQQITADVVMSAKEDMV